MKRKATFWAVLPVIICLLYAPLTGAQEVVFNEDFEDGLIGWSVDNGIWALCGAQENQYPGTVCGGNYPAGAGSRLVSPDIALPAAMGEEEVLLRFRQNFGYSDTDDDGQVQVSVYDAGAGQWSAFSDVGGPITDSTIGWSLGGADLTPFAGKTIRVAFNHTAVPASDGGTGWFVDDVSVVKKVPVLSGDFVRGWGGWFAGNGVWQICTIAGIPCAGTVCGKDYPKDTDSRLVGPTIQLPDDEELEEIYLRLHHYFFYFASHDRGYYQVRTYEDDAEAWSDWETVGDMVTGPSGGWVFDEVDLSPYAGETIKIGFYHTANQDGSTRPGWYLETVEFPGITPVIHEVEHDRYALPSCTAVLAAKAENPLDGALTYHWDAPEGGQIEGSGPQVEFSVTPEEARIEPYPVRVSATAVRSHIGSLTSVVNIYTRLVNDDDGDDDMDGKDLAAFIANFDADGMARMAEEFGMMGCR